MPKHGAFTLGDLQKRGVMIHVSCRKCPRKGCYKLAGLIRRYGEDMTLPNLASALSADCPRQDGSIYQRCNVVLDHGGRKT